MDSRESHRLSGGQLVALSAPLWSLLLALAVCVLVGS